MQNSIWKLTSLAGVIAVTCLVILLIRQDADEATRAQESSAQQSTTAAAESADVELGPAEQLEAAVGTPGTAGEPTPLEDPDWPPAEPAPGPAPGPAPAPALAQTSPADPGIDFNVPTEDDSEMRSAELFQRVGDSRSAPTENTTPTENATSTENTGSTEPAGPSFGDFPGPSPAANRPRLSTADAGAEARRLEPDPDSLQDSPAGNSEAPPFAAHAAGNDERVPTREQTVSIGTETGTATGTHTQQTAEGGPALFSPEQGVPELPHPGPAAGSDPPIVQTGNTETLEGALTVDELGEETREVSPDAELIIPTDAATPGSAGDPDPFPPLDFGDAASAGPEPTPTRDPADDPADAPADADDPAEPPMIDGSSQPDFVEDDPFGSVPVNLDSLPPNNPQANGGSPFADLPEAPAADSDTTANDSQFPPLDADFPGADSVANPPDSEPADRFPAAEPQWPQLDADGADPAEPSQEDFPALPGFGDDGDDRMEPAPAGGNPPDTSNTPPEIVPTEPPALEESTGPGPSESPGLRELPEGRSRGPELGFPAVDSDVNTDAGGEGFGSDPNVSGNNEPDTDIAETRPAPLRLAPAPSAVPIPTASTDKSSVDEPAAAKADLLLGDGVIDRHTLPETLRPQLQIQKSAPPKAVLGQPFVYHILIRNVGSTDADQVVVEDRIPKGGRLQGTIPRAELSGKKLIWKLGKLAAGEQTKISVRIIPTQTGEIGSIATVTSVAEVGAATEVTAPSLELEVDAPDELVVGESSTFRFTVRNTGGGAATNVYIREIIPEGLSHAAGSDLEYAVGTLDPGQSRMVQLTLQATEPGSVTNRAVATADGGIRKQIESEIEVTGTQLALERQGPAKRFVGHPATYENRITNESDQAVVNATVVEVIPEGLEFVEATDGGRFDPDKRTVIWQVQHLDPSQSRVLKVRVVPRQSGDHTSVVQVFEERGGKSKTTSTTHVSGFASLGLDVSEVDRPVAVGERILMTIRARNRGTATAQNVQLTLKVPDELEVQSVHRGDTEVEFDRTQNSVKVPAVPGVEGRGHVTFKVLLTAKAAADARLLIQVDADQMSRSISREEAILIVTD